MINAGLDLGCLGECQPWRSICLIHVADDGRPGSSLMKIKVIVVAALLAAGASGAMAAINTLIGTTFDVTYDTAVQGPYGAPSIVFGNSIHWTPSAAFAADSNGVDSFGALTQVVITAHTGFQLKSFGYSEDGSYTLAGDVTNLYVNVSGLVDVAPLVAPDLTVVHRTASLDPRPAAGN